MLTGANWSTTSLTGLLRPLELGVTCFCGSLAGESTVALGVGDLEEEAGAAPPPIKSLTSLFTSSLSFAKGSGAAFGICWIKSIIERDRRIKKKC